MRTLQYAVYKGKSGKFGAAQWNLQNPHYYCNACKVKNFTSESHPPTTNPKGCSGEMILREGAVFLEITSTKAPDVYDWENKIVMALSVTDLGKLLITLRTGNELKLLHDPGAGSDKKGQVRKNLYVSSPKGIENGCMITASQTDGTAEKKHVVPLSYDEVCVLGSLISTAIPRALAWA